MAGREMGRGSMQKLNSWDSTYKFLIILCLNKIIIIVHRKPMSSSYSRKLQDVHIGPVLQHRIQL